MDTSFMAGVVVLALAGVAFVLLALWLQTRNALAQASACLCGRGCREALEERIGRLEKRTAGVEALLVSTVGQETEDFCRAMDGIVDRMKAPEPAPKLTLSPEHVGRFGKGKKTCKGRIDD